MPTLIKIVPDIEPNAEGEWIVAIVELQPNTRWREAEGLLLSSIPFGHHMVSYRSSQDGYPGNIEPGTPLPVAFRA